MHQAICAGRREQSRQAISACTVYLNTANACAACKQRVQISVTKLSAALSATDSQTMKSKHASKQPAVAHVYDILNCGPRNRFVANGKIVSNCNLQNLKRPEFDDQGKQVPNTGELRQSILAPAGHCIVVADSAQIEARGLAWQADEETILNEFRAKGGDPYKRMASMIYGVPFDQVVKMQRFIGKVCLSADTQVLTNHGWKPIIQVTVTDLVWDGVEWVQHQGLLDQGTQEVIQSYGVTATPDHEILTGHGWQTWRAVHTNPSLFQSALSSAISPYSDGKPIPSPWDVPQAGTPSCAALVVGKAVSTVAISAQEDPRAVTPAQKLPLTPSAIGSTHQSSPTTSIAHGYSTESAPASSDATHPRAKCTVITGGAESLYGSLGAATAPHFSGTSSAFPDGSNQNSNSTAPTLISDTSLGTCDFPREAKTYAINEKSEIFKTKLPTYDLASAGPRSRFTIWSDRGPLIVHNCVLGLGYGMGHVKFQVTLEQGVMGPKVLIELDEAKHIVGVYRTANKEVVKYWRFLESILIRMMSGHTGSWKCFEYGPGWVRMPSGLFLHYPDLRGTPVEMRNGDVRIQDMHFHTLRGRNKIYGGLFAENLTQSMCRDIVAEQMLMVRDAGWRVVTMTHDEIVCVAPKKQAARCYDEMLQAMKTSPKWAVDLPLKAEGGWSDNYSK